MGGWISSVFSIPSVEDLRKRLDMVEEELREYKEKESLENEEKHGSDQKTPK